MPEARIKSVDLAPKSGQASVSVQVVLEDGGGSAFLAASPDQPSEWVRERGYFFGPPVLFVPRVDRRAVEAATASMARTMGGYWLRYYDSPAVQKTGKSVAAKIKVLSVALTEAYPPRKPGHGCAVAEVRLGDGREFSMLTATPSWFKEIFEKQLLPFYFGPAVLFLRSLDLTLVRKAAQAMAREGDRWFCLYDTPRTTLPQVLSEFKGRALA